MSPGLGISLATNHAIHDIARVEGGKRYVRMMRRLPSPSARHPRNVLPTATNDELKPMGMNSPPNYTMEDLWDDWPRQTWRSMRKNASLAASSDVAILCGMPKEFIQIAAPSPRNAPVSAIMGYPALPGLNQEDIADAAAYRGIRLLGGNHEYPPHEMVAAYAGHGMGLCESFDNEERCSNEGLELPVRQTLLAEHTEAAMLLHCRVMREAYDLAHNYLHTATSFELDGCHASEKNNLALIRDLIQRLLLRTYQVSGLPEEINIILTGSSGCVEQMDVQTAIREAAQSLGPKMNVLTSPPKRIAARGAAELACRALIRTEATKIQALNHSKEL